MGKSLKFISVLLLSLHINTDLHASDLLTSDVISGWGFSKSPINGFRKYGYRVVEKHNGHPVRSGNQSIRFEIRSGDCGYNQGWSDCEEDRERHELSGSSKRYTMAGGEYWFAWSIYLPDDFNIIYPTKTTLGQFHQINGHVVWMFQNHNGGYWVDNQTSGSTVEKKKIFSDSEMRGKWNDIIIHAKWTHMNDGFFDVYVNNISAPVYQWTGPTKSKGKQVYFKFGIYRSFLQRWKNANSASSVPAQIVYFDEIRRGIKRSDIKDRRY